MQQAVQIHGLPSCAPVCKALPNHPSRIALAMMASVGAITLLLQIFHSKVLQRGECL